MHVLRHTNMNWSEIPLRYLWRRFVVLKFFFFFHLQFWVKLRFFCMKEQPLLWSIHRPVDTQWWNMRTTSASWSYLVHSFLEVSILGLCPVCWYWRLLVWTFTQCSELPRPLVFLGNHRKSHHQRICSYLIMKLQWTGPSDYKTEHENHAPGNIFNALVKNTAVERCKMLQRGAEKLPLESYSAIFGGVSEANKVHLLKYSVTFSSFCNH